MTLDTKKLLLAILVTFILLILFLGYAFNSIQEVELDIQVLENQEINTELEAIARKIINNQKVKFCDNVSIEDIGSDILLVDHNSNSACLVSQQLAYAVDYNQLDKSMINCNSFIVLINNVKTVIINTDPRLGNSIVRAITAVYHYEYGAINRLSPESVQHFQTSDEDQEVNFLRYSMIESMRRVYFDDEKLDSFYYYYDQWVDVVGLNQYKEVINYDYYDGLKAYISVKVLELVDKDFNLEEYVDTYYNQFDIYSKDDEYSVMGLLWCLVAEKQGKSILLNDDNQGNLYKMILEGIPLGDLEVEELQSDYKKKFELYQDDIKGIVKDYSYDIGLVNPKPLIMKTESYDGTIKMDDTHYVYINYFGVDSHDNLIQEDYLTVEVRPYSILYYIR